jgi:hypothetical protein
LTDYVEGINFYFNEFKFLRLFNFLTPEFYLIGYTKPENFTIEDVGSLLFLLSYMG